jgi:hypothetical protein
VGLRFGRVAGALALTGLLTMAGCGGSVIKATAPTIVNGGATPTADTKDMAPAATAAASPTRAPVAPTEAPSPTQAPVTATAQVPGKPTSPTVVTTPTRGSMAPALILTVLEPADESVVTKSPILVRGQTTAGAVVSVNALLAEVNAAGAFSALIPLEEGPNLIEVVASDDAGNELTQELLLVFEP